MENLLVRIRNKLIEVALPLQAINEATAREKSIRQGMPIPKCQSIRGVGVWPVLKAELRKLYMQPAGKEGLIFQTVNGTPPNPSNSYKT